MNVLILGNSNSILKDGFVTYLKHIKSKCQFVNLSIGGSPSPALLMQSLININKLDNIDVAIIEPTVIDHGEDWQNASHISKHAQYLISFLAKKSIKILLLVLPRNDKAVIKETNGMLAWSEIAKKNEIAVVNGSDLIKKYSVLSEIPIKQCWRDDKGHPTAECQRFIGEYVASRIDDLENSSVIFLPNKEFSLLDSKKISESALCVEIVNRGNSYLQYKCCQMTINSFIKLSLPDDMIIHGLLVNYGEMSPGVKTLIDLETESGVDVIDISNKFLSGEPSRKFMVLYRSIKVVEKCCSISLSKTLENSRFRENEKLEIVGILIGPKLENLQFELLNNNIEKDR